MLVFFEQRIAKVIVAAFHDVYAVQEWKHDLIEELSDEPEAICIVLRRNFMF